MGAYDFYTKGWGITAKLAFESAVKKAEYDYGHRGYTGTIAEKSNFIMIELPRDFSPEKFAETLIFLDDERICDKWGPAGCIEVPEDYYSEEDKKYKERYPEERLFLFFGWASA